MLLEHGVHNLCFAPFLSQRTLSHRSVQTVWYGKELIEMAQSYRRSLPHIQIKMLTSRYNLGVLDLGQYDAEKVRNWQQWLWPS